MLTPVFKRTRRPPAARPLRRRSARHQSADDAEARRGARRTEPLAEAGRSRCPNTAVAAARSRRGETVGRGADESQGDLGARSSVPPFSTFDAFEGTPAERSLLSDAPNTAQGASTPTTIGSTFVTFPRGRPVTDEIQDHLQEGRLRERVAAKLDRRRGTPANAQAEQAVFRLCSDAAGSGQHDADWPRRRRAGPSHVPAVRWTARQLQPEARAARRQRQLPRADRSCPGAAVPPFAAVGRHRDRDRPALPACDGGRPCQPLRPGGSWSSSRRRRGRRRGSRRGSSWWSRSSSSSRRRGERLDHLPAGAGGTRTRRWRARAGLAHSARPPARGGQDDRLAEREVRRAGGEQLSTPPCHVIFSSSRLPSPDHHLRRARRPPDAVATEAVELGVIQAYGGHERNTWFRCPGQYRRQAVKFRFSTRRHRVPRRGLRAEAG